jgi:4-hydroxyphenylpyruvate dioxygenase-like putative hemolysin
MNNIRCKLEETIKNQMENVLVSVDRQTQGLLEELNKEIEETQRHLQLVITSIDRWTRSFKDDIMDTKKDFHEAIVNIRKNLHQMLNHRTQGTQSEIESTKTLVDARDKNSKTR